jgi:hypothetical protein
VAHAVPIEGMKITSAQLQDISFQICRGNAAFGLLLANRYLPSESPLRRALATKAQQRLPEKVVKSPVLLRALVDGSSATRIPENWSKIIGAKVPRPKTRIIPTPVMRDFSRRGNQLAKRHRSFNARVRFPLTLVVEV